MLAPFIRLLLALACGALVLSMPVMRTTAGALLRRVAAICFILALLPSLLVGLFSTGAAGARRGDTSAVAAFGCIAVFVVLVLVAYGVLQLRARLRARAKPRDPWEALFGRGAGKRPFYRAAAQRRIRLVDQEDDV